MLLHTAHEQELRKVRLEQRRGAKHEKAMGRHVEPARVWGLGLKDQGFGTRDYMEGGKGVEG